jgi:hypothetical protein
MPDSNQISDYRQCIYDQYLAKKVRPGGEAFSAKEYQRWADAATSRLRDWLPADRQSFISRGASDFTDPQCRKSLGIIATVW